LGTSEKVVEGWSEMWLGGGSKWICPECVEKVKRRGK
jgi:hypothetical protein